MSLAEAMAKLYSETEASVSGETAVSAETNFTSAAAREQQSDLQTEKKDRIYWLRKCSGSGCPYTASWMAHINLYKRLVWNIDNTKMEAASFEIFDKASFKFQLEDHTAFFVHHLSHFEHAVHKRSGFELAENLTKVMANAAFEGECVNLQVSDAENTIAFIPFFGGRPPGVTASLQVKSIGQGNSLVGPEIKAMLTMSTICSCLKYFGQVVIGVSRDQDATLINNQITPIILKNGHSLKRYIHVVQLELGRPAYLPFHLLAWGQNFVREHNCVKVAEAKSVAKGHPNFELYEICDNEPFRHKGKVIVTSYNKSALSYEREKEVSAGTKTLVPFKYVYFTESDQIVRFDSFKTMTTLMQASNSTCFFVGRRKEKDGTSDASEYMKFLNGFRQCGASGYYLNSATSPDGKLIDKYAYKEAR